MKAHYINILLFALPLNILVTSSSNVHNKNKPQNTQRHTPTTRLLCECELYAPVNYDNDPQMKKVMENFHKQTQKRFEEYDDRMKTIRQKCKEQCDKEIQKIILNDKLEKELMDKFATLQTDIQSDSIPTCICEKSLADKTEKFCLNCGKTIGAVAPGWGLVSGLGYAAWETAATAAAIELATKKGIEEGIKVVIAQIKDKSLFGMRLNVQWTNFINGSNYSSASRLLKAVTNAMNSNVKSCPNTSYSDLCSVLSQGETAVVKYATAGKQATESTTATAEAIELGKVTTASTHVYSPIAYSIVAILIIILIMVIIYLILRYRRKKKMKKKLKYIKLLEE
ncbi:rifin PIR protein, putative [Plasmodium reichenowi]|uniref:Rifin PIR protein, putative n=1 Tax=Plasmodium reichenowi TaxID=5854 RepID=A0A2P9DSJ1_PLARE|nr:rifin PIR protein, putative [Plasmodium reichenowi]